MQKIGSITPTADANGEWTNGNVAAGTAPTNLDAAWLNTVQRELANIVTGGGLVLDPANDAQVLAALKKIFLQTGNNLSEIAASGAAAQSAARTSLGLLSAALRAVGTGTNQIPDMASFNSGSANAFRLPTGHFVQYDSGVSNLGGVSKAYPVPFPTSCEALIGIIYSPTPVRAFVSSNISGRTTAFLTVVDPNGNGISGITVGYIAIGY